MIWTSNLMNCGCLLALIGFTACLQSGSERNKILREDEKPPRTPTQNTENSESEFNDRLKKLKPFLDEILNRVISENNFEVTIADTNRNLNEVRDSFHVFELMNELTSWGKPSPQKLEVAQLAQKYSTIMVNLRSFFTENCLRFDENLHLDLDSGLNMLTELSQIAGLRIDGDFVQILEKADSLYKKIRSTSLRILLEEDSKNSSLHK